MDRLRAACLLVVAAGSGWLAFELWGAWGMAARNSASPGAVVLPIAAAIFAVMAIGALLRVALLLRKRGTRPQ